ncbi:hypothetical protein COW36_20420 [bacterium (Candidatus Blackallbacteria) CG17_big_fil_post_rev_8_21_14_2_50_48_46]|uniref:HTH merR-type domain-containing protein n=1 Tax=bacterium (Candidatus Blackallbacteria) CG17_big_fil_post_rev_8_21_14_2_50_48_46 TaxID=2014261 RepID=A0A2M7FZG8_9BACT|nr:MAG: hypothetical protein COW64_22745 [bacterium (Candidatus Blackallbacteria) CG18_big_fil_WC_8_21_14_2_50_49_26]PIW14770.1 MAG: hypothetical protein COW36_20420 [bacterium (Candidatus Blackallbacteria) CG17_big_fil_post_rev_8_21_14_2_50_48_46]PIW50872.1 MAG: hypothetical protein COW20_01235 [bacterium (Candidatus Blackallbacteria) CG13_big_fil_rev_8_21_14_2_50_49_14]
MKIQDLAKTLEVSQEQLQQWVKELALDLPKDEAGQPLFTESWVPYFKQVKTLYAAGRKADEIARAVPKPESAAAPAKAAPDAGNLNSKQALQETLRQMEMRIVSLQFHLKNTQGEMVKEQKNLAKVQTQVEEMNRTVDVIQRSLSGAQSSTENVNQFLSRFWLYQALTVLITVMLVLVLGRVFSPPAPKPVPVAPVASPTELQESDDLNSASPSATPSP